MSLAQVNGHRALRAEVRIPLVGSWNADVLLDEGVEITGPVTLTIAGLSLVGTAYRGGAYKGSAGFRIVAGGDGWRKKLEPRAYRSEAGVRLSTILTDVARESGETIVVANDRVVGQAFVRQAGPASRVFGLLGEASSAWYVDAAGVTQTTARPVSTVRSRFEVLHVVAELGRAVIATEKPEDIVPGRRIDVGLPAPIDIASVFHHVEPDRLTTTVSRLGALELDGFTRAVREALPCLDYQALYEYEVVEQHGDKLDVRPIDKRFGFPVVLRAVMLPGLAGSTPKLKTRARVLVGWVNGDPTRPFVSHYEATSGAGGTPDEVAVQAGDIVLHGGLAGVSATEHATSVEAMVAFGANLLFAFGTAVNTAGPGPVTGAGLLGLLSPAGLAGIVNAAIAGVVAPATGTIAAYALAISGALSSKAANVTGTLPGLGWPHVKGG